MTPTDHVIPLERLFERIRGLRPAAWVCVGAGYSREDLKALALASEQGFVADAITTVQDLCLKLLSIPREKCLGPLARQEVLRVLLGEARISARMPELKRLRRQGNFFRRLDFAVQAGRMAFAHPEEEEVYSQRLHERFGPNPVRGEIRALASAYAAWLRESGLWDPPMLLREAADRLRSGWPAHVAKPEELHHFSAVTPESLEKDFWEALGAHLEARHHGPTGERSASSQAWKWERWHTLDDAAESLAERLAGRGDWENHVILIPDHAGARRSLKRALKAHGIPEADPRDPTRLVTEEAVKWAALPLQVVGKNFEREAVISWLRGYFATSEFSAWVSEINSRGVRSGLRSYQGGSLVHVHSRLSELARDFGGRKSCAEFGEAHLRLLRMSVGVEPERAWVLPVFEGVWNDLVSEMARVGQNERRAPLIYWSERLEALLTDPRNVPVERLKPERGVAVYRLHQGALQPPSNVWVFGIPPSWLTGEGVGDYWFTERERELLSGEFAVRSAIQVREERLLALCAWSGRADSVTWLDAQYDLDGRERETILPVLRELAARSGLEAPGEPDEMGSHRRWSKSYGALRPSPPQLIELEPLVSGAGGAPPEISATALDAYSRCGFQGLAYHRWRIQDIRVPDTELWPEVRGTILHEAVRILMASRDAEGRFARAPEGALEEAWGAKRPRGLLRGERVERYAKSRLLPVLRAFCEKEREYAARAGTKAISLDESRLRLEYEDFAVVGKPDRIDEHPEGLFVIDYKTSSALPNALEMIELGYRLQLPFYALASRKALGKPVLGAQFVELNRKAGRTAGVFFKQYNGKEPGKLTHTRSRSVLAVTPEEAWSTLEEQLVRHAKAYVGGRFEARPKKKDKECRSCALSDVCGMRRMADAAEEAQPE